MCIFLSSPSGGNTCTTDGFLLDTNVLIALLDRNSPAQGAARMSLAAMLAFGEDAWPAPQTIVEFWAVATKPVTSSGLGWTRDRTVSEVGRLLAMLPMLAESSELFPIWLGLVSEHSISGKHVHDARLAAIMPANGIPKILTFNVKDFPDRWGIAAVRP